MVDTLVRGLLREEGVSDAEPGAARICCTTSCASSITVAGVAFAVTLVLVQVGLFLGLLDNATVTIEHIDADLWVTSRNTPNVDFAHAFPETRVQRVRSVPGVERADNLIVQFMNIPADGRRGGHAGLRARGLRALGTCPGT